MLYQQDNSLSEHLKFENGRDFNFPLHLHGNFELIVVTEGTMNIIVDKNKYVLHEKDALLIFPNQIHELYTPEHSRHFLCIFPPMFVQAYNKVFLFSEPKDAMFRLDDFYIQKFISLCENGASLISVKGLLYSICAEFDKNASYIAKNNDSKGLIEKILHFVELNYSKDCSLTTLSAELMYNYVYLSKYFKESTGISFTDYVNRYRINESCYALQNSVNSIIKIAYDCGFDSLRSFNRNFKNIMGMSPSEYREKF